MEPATAAHPILSGFKSDVGQKLLQEDMPTYLTDQKVQRALSEFRTLGPAALERHLGDPDFFQSKMEIREKLAASNIELPPAAPVLVKRAV